MKRLFKFKYPKIAILILVIFLAYFIFSNFDANTFVNNLGIFGFISYFFAGMLFSFGFTTPFAIGFFATANPTNILLMAIIGGIGALISDFFILKLIRFSFMDEFNRLERTSPLRMIHKKINKTLSRRIRNYLLFVLAGFIIASPLPDEIGVVMLAGLGHIKPLPFVLISFIMNSLGILIMLLI